MNLDKKILIDQFVLGDITVLKVCGDKSISKSDAKEALAVIQFLLRKTELATTCLEDPSLIRLADRANEEFKKHGIQFRAEAAKPVSSFFDQVDGFLAIERYERKDKWQSFVFEIKQAEERDAGITGFSDKVTIRVEAGDPGGVPGHFIEHMEKALQEWYGGAKVELVLFQGPRMEILYRTMHIDPGKEGDE